MVEIITIKMKIKEMDISLTDDEAEALLIIYDDKDDISAYAKKSVTTCLKAGIVTL